MLISAVNLLTLDLIYSDLPRLPAMGEEVITDRFTLALGGGPPASLVTASRLGAPVRLATCLGDDIISNITRGLLADEGIVWKSFNHGEKAQTPVNITSVMTFTGSDRAFASYFPKLEFYCSHVDEMFGYVKDAGICIASYASIELFKRLKDHGVKLLYDTGWHDGLSLAGLEEALSYAYLFTPNQKEAEKLTGKADPWDALEILAGYVEVPTVKLGDNGALVMYGGKAVHIQAFDFEAVDSTGAGDAFMGGVAYGLSQNWDILECVSLGCYCGGKAATGIGCLSARPSLEEFERMRNM